jgi:imidazoleglycerol-phosphate dehydratase
LKLGKAQRLTLQANPSRRKQMEVSGVLSRTSTFSSLTKPRRLPTTTISHTNLVPTRIHYPNPIFSSTPLLMDFHTTTTTKPLATPLQANGSSLTTSSPIESGTNLSLLHLLSDSSQSLSGANFDCLFSGSARIGEVKRVTKETNVFVKINLDGTGIADSSTGIPFLDHMLDVSNLFFLFGFY